MVKLIYICIGLAVISLLIASVCQILGALFIFRIYPRTLLGFSSVMLLFGINFGLLALIKLR